MWGGFPSIAYKEEIDSGDIAMFIEDIYGLQIVLGEHLVTKKHVFTHLIWDMVLIKCQSKSNYMSSDPEVNWIEANRIKDYPLPTAFSKLIS